MKLKFLRKMLSVLTVALATTGVSAQEVNCTGSITLPLLTSEPTYSSTELGTCFLSNSYSVGSSFTIESANYQLVKNGEVIKQQTGLKNTSGVKINGGVTEEHNKITITLTPQPGLTFTPTNVSFEAARYGTDGGLITSSVTANGTCQVSKDATYNRSQLSLPLSTISSAITGVTANYEKPLNLVIYINNLDNTKTSGLSGITITGTVTGQKTQTTTYTLNTNVSPAEAGSVTLNPQMDVYVADTKVNMTATKNFGYRFKEWKLGETIVSTDAAYEVTMDADKTYTAVFESVNTYAFTAKSEGDNGLSTITLNPQPTDGKYEDGTEVTMTAGALSGVAEFVGWSDGVTDATRTITINGEMNFTANYKCKDFIALFNAQKNEYYASNDANRYPFPADFAWDANRAATSAIVKKADGTILLGNGATPVVRNRKGAVLSTICGLYQNGFNTSEIAFQYSFSTLGFSNVVFAADMAAKNAAKSQYQAEYSIDGGKTFNAIGEAWTVTANELLPISLTLPADANDKERVVVRISGVDGSSMFNDSYPFTVGECEGLNYCAHSEMGIGNIVITGDFAVTIPVPSSYVYSTFCSPYTLDFSAVEGIVANTITVNGETLVLNSVTGAVPAGTGLLIKKVAEVGSVKVPTAQSASPVADNALVGLTSAITAQELYNQGGYILVDDTKFQKVGAGSTGELAAGKAYLKVPVSSNAHILYFDGATAIENAKAIEDKKTMIYNAQGMRVSKVTAPGMYIIDGKKVTF